MQNFITIFFTVLEIEPFSLFQNLEFGKASTEIKCQFAISWARSCQYQYLRKIFSVFEPRLNLDLSQISFDNLIGYILSISMCMQNFITIFQSVQEIEPFSLFQNLALGKASTDDKCHFAIPWARSCQHQIVCKILSKIFQTV